MYNISIISHRRKYSVNFDNSEIKIDHDCFVLIDSNIEKLYPSLVKNLDKNRVIVIEAIEKNKSLVYCQELMKLLIKKNIKKNHKLVAIGGGITQDITGFISSILFRGVDWVFYPTTLLAQADSCIGSKTSINFLQTKNLVGTFYPPKEINCKPEFLNSLREVDIKSGIGEILHYYIFDGNDKITQLTEQYNQLFSNRSLLIPHIKESLSIKKTMVEKDEFDTNERRVFNYGHTFGHAIETISNHQVAHGQAVTLGMDLANHISHELGFLSKEDFHFLSSTLNKNMPKFVIRSNNIDQYINFLAKDKKNIDKSIVCILASSFGNLFVHHINDIENLKKMILDYFRRTDDKHS